MCACCQPAGLLPGAGCAVVMVSVPAEVASAQEAQAIAEVRKHSAGPLALPRRLPLRRFWHLGRGEVVERDVLAVGAGAAEAAGAQHAGDGGERRDVLL